MDTIKKGLLKHFSNSASTVELHRIVSAPDNQELRGTFAQVGISNSGSIIEPLQDPQRTQAIRELVQDGKLQIGEVQALESYKFYNIRTQRLTPTGLEK